MAQNLKGIHDLKNAVKTFIFDILTFYKMMFLSPIRTKWLTFTLIVGFILGCAGTKKMAITPSQADVDRVAGKFPGYTMADLTQGKTLFDSHCGSCHGYPKFTELDEKGWQKIIPPMVKKASEKTFLRLDATAEQQILRYCLTMREAVLSQK